MKPSINCITLPVDDLQKSIAFYRDGLGLPADGVGDSDDHAALELPGGLYLVLIVRTEFAGFTQLTNQAVAPRGSSECILSYFAASREEVAAILRGVEAAGGMVTEAKDRPWGYAGYFTDPDGHLWEIVWNQAFAQGKAQ